jgi:hypothetical protein
MSKKPGSDDIRAVLREPGVRTAFFLKTCLLSALFLPVLLASQAAKAESQPIQVLNAGLNDAWYYPDTSGQGFFVTVFPDLGKVSLAWFTYDTELSPIDAFANLGDAGHRWMTALGRIDGNRAVMNIVLTSGGIFDTPGEIQRTDPPGSDGTLTLTFDSCNSGTVEYNIPSIDRQGIIPIQRIANDNIVVCEALAAPDPNACTRPDPDLSHALDEPPITRGATVPREEIVGGGPGPDGIPPLEFPQFAQNAGSANLNTAELVVGVKVGNDIRAYPHRILNWHEVVNDQFTMAGVPERSTLSYCPLTGSAVLWDSFMEAGDETFGTSGLLYNSNLIMYDRATESLWSQMLEQSIRGVKIQQIPDRLQVVETTWGTWQAMYPETLLLTEETGISRDYNDYPYGSYREDNSLLFSVDNMDDNRLHRKERVLGINVGSRSKVYPITNFSNNVEVINDTVGDMQVVVAGSSSLNFGVVYNRELEDCTVLDFEAVQNKLPVVMRDNEGNEWDVFGTAVSGARTGQQLQKTNSYVSYWFAWTAFFSGKAPEYFIVNIHQ